jgi:hypothetical protein
MGSHQAPLHLLGVSVSCSSVAVGDAGDRSRAHDSLPLSALSSLEPPWLHGAKYRASAAGGGGVLCLAEHCGGMTVSLLRTGEWLIVRSSTGLQKKLDKMQSVC